MILRQFMDGDPLDLPPILYFAMYNRVSYVHRVTTGTLTQDEVSMLSFKSELEEDW